ncbi:MAG TPA: MFS transporter [Acidimicrobiales bacterium]|nr:MFS transporter [Acidimicrobiales bacterium]
MANVDWGRYGRRPAMLLAGVAFIDAVDRSILPGVLTRVQDDFGFSDFRAGLLSTAAVFAGFLVVLPSGYAADRFKRTRVIALVLASWGAISAVNAAVQNYGQFLGVRAVLGAGETIDNPASQSLMADYYAPEVRGRAFGLQRIAPIVGGPIGIGLGALVAKFFGWRAAFLIVGVPGSILALTMSRMIEPRRGESDHPTAADEDHSSPIETDRRGARALLADVREVLRIKTVRSLMIGTAIAAGATQGLAFWAPAFYERHSTLGRDGGAGAAAGLILVGALLGTWAGALAIDRLRDRYEGAPMLIAAVTTFVGGVLLWLTFFPVPLWFRLPVQVVGVAGIVAGLPGLTVMLVEVVPPTMRGIAASVTGFLAALVAAASPPVVGLLADQFKFNVNGELKGHVANAFLIVTPLVWVAAVVVWRGRRYVTADIDRATASRGSTVTDPR